MPTAAWLLLILPTANLMNTPGDGFLMLILRLLRSLCLPLLSLKVPCPGLLDSDAIIGGVMLGGNLDIIDLKRTSNGLTNKNQFLPHLCVDNISVTRHWYNSPSQPECDGNWRGHSDKSS